jgi:hypothetical protein
MVFSAIRRVVTNIPFTKLALSHLVERLISHANVEKSSFNVGQHILCSLEKVSLFDVVSKLYRSTDPSGPVNMLNVELCSDMIDVVLDVSSIYGLGPAHLELGNRHQHHNSDMPSSLDHGKGESTGKLVGTLINQAPAEDLEGEMIDP